MEVLGLALVSLVIFFLVRRSDQNKEPSVKALLVAIDHKIAIEPDNPNWYLLQAELLLRTAAHWSSLNSLERAFAAGMSKAELEPSYWAVYGQITDPYHSGYFGDADSGGSTSGVGVNQKFFRRLEKEAPTLSKVMAYNLSESESRFTQRKSDPFLSSDKARRAQIYAQSVKMFGISELR